MEPLKMDKTMVIIPIGNDLMPLLLNRNENIECFWATFAQRPACRPGDSVFLELGGTPVGVAVVCNMEPLPNGNWIIHWHGDSFRQLN